MSATGAVCWLLTEQWDGQGGWRDDLSEQEEEDGEREEDRYAQGDLQGTITNDVLGGTSLINIHKKIKTSNDCIEQSTFKVTETPLG